ncbi:MAG: Na(+)-translocating NADH-quinone reductase subunit C [Gammaproteobacteria bacterium]
MNKSSLHSLGVLIGVALICSVLVSVATTSLRPIQERNQLLERYRHVVALTGLVEDSADDDTVFQVVSQLDARVVDLETGEFASDMDPDSVNSRSAANDPERSSAIPADSDFAGLGRRANHEVVYLVWADQSLSRIILPISGQGMWSTLYGFIALEDDFNTVASTRFYEQGETAGIGDQVEDPAWQAQWQGRRLFDDSGNVRFRVAGGSVDPSAASAAYEVDGLTGATVTGGAVTNLVRYWFGPHGYGQLLSKMSERPPER